MKSQTVQPDDILGYSPEMSAVITNSSRTAIFKAIKNGQLVARKVGRRTTIPREDLIRWFNAQPMRGRVKTAGVV
jgi:hypothetical protein